MSNEEKLRVTLTQDDILAMIHAELERDYPGMPISQSAHIVLTIVQPLLAKFVRADLSEPPQTIVFRPEWDEGMPAQPLPVAAPEPPLGTCPMQGVGDAPHRSPHARMLGCGPNWKPIAPTPPPAVAEESPLPSADIAYAIVKEWLDDKTGDEIEQMQRLVQNIAMVIEDARMAANFRAAACREALSVDAVRKLIAKWRNRVDGKYGLTATGSAADAYVAECADELESLLGGSK